jgi:hypothetical protein
MFQIGLSMRARAVRYIDIATVQFTYMRSSLDGVLDQ